MNKGGGKMSILEEIKAAEKAAEEAKREAKVKARNIVREAEETHLKRQRL